MIEISKEMLKSCQLKKKKTFSYSRMAISFFFRRSLEIFDSFLILIKEKKLVAAAVLLRSLCNMAIDNAYIYKDEKKKEFQSIKYLLEGDRAQKKLLEKNIKELSKSYKDLDSRLAELESNIKEMERKLTEKYKEKDWRYLKSIADRAKKAGPIIENYYNQVYSYYSNIEHHNFLFGQAYVDSKNCEPLEQPEKIEKSSLFRPEVTLFMFRGLFLGILSRFNQEYKLTWNKKLLELKKIHYEELDLLKD